MESSCHSPSGAPRRPWGCRESTLPHPCWRDCGRTSRWAATASRPTTSREIPVGIPPPPTPALHKLRQFAKVAIARSQLRPRVADSDDRAAIEQIMRPALILHPTAIQEPHFVLPAIPFLTAELLHVCDSRVSREVRIRNDDIANQNTGSGRTARPTHLDITGGKPD